MIVTNDEYETPIVCDIVGKQATADYLGIGMTQFWRCLKADKWIGEYKAVDLGYEDEQEEFEGNKDVKPLSEIEREKVRAERRRKKHLQSVQRTKESQRQYMITHKEEINERMKRYYQEHKEERKAYSREYWKRKTSLCGK